MLAALGFRRTTWNGYETNKSKPSFDDLLKIARYFGVELSDLVERDLSKGKVMANAEAPENTQKSKLTGKGKGILNAGLATATEVSEPDSPGYNNSNEDLTS